MRTKLSTLIIAVWVVAGITIGYLVAPVLFAQLTERAVAGRIAGVLFSVQAWLSVGASLVLGCTAVGYFALAPQIAALREQAAAAGVDVTQTADALRFAWLHGASSALYLLQSLLGALLLWRSVPRQQA